MTELERRLRRVRSAVAEGRPREARDLADRALREAASQAGAASGIGLTKPINIINTAQTIAVMETGGAGNPFLNNTSGSINPGNFVNQPIPQSAGDTKDGGIAFRHPPSSGATCNMLFADLHVESVSRDDTRLQTREGREKMMSISK